MNKWVLVPFVVLSLAAADRAFAQEGPAGAGLLEITLIPGGGTVFLESTDAAAPSYFQHVGLYAYRRDALLRFVTLAQGEAERAEGREQLRALEHGLRIRCAVIEGWQSVPVDVPADVARVEAQLARR